MKTRERILHEFEVANLPSSVHLVRSFVSHEISRLPLSPDARFDLLTAVGEAADNSALYGHAGGVAPDTIRTRIVASEEAVRVEVWDNGAGYRPDLSRVPEPDLMAEHGRGLFIMLALADEVAYPRVRRGTLCAISKQYDLKAGSEGLNEEAAVEKTLPAAAERVGGKIGSGGAGAMPPEVYASMARNAIEGIWVLDANGKTSFMNERMAQLLGYSAHEVLGRSVFEFMDEQGRRVAEKAKKRREAGISEQMEQTFLRSDGRLVYAIVVTNPLYDEHGRYSGSLGLITDITERKQAEEALRASEARFRGLFNHMAEGVALHEVVYEDDRPVDYRILDVNEAFERIVGIGRGAAIGRLASDLYGTGEPPYLEVYARVAETGRAEGFETYFSPMEKHFSISAFSPGKGLFGTVFTDITGRKRAEERSVYMASFPDKNPSPVLEIQEGRVVYLNPAARRLLPCLELGKRVRGPLRKIVESIAAAEEETSSVEARLGSSRYRISIVKGDRGLLRLYAVDVG
ncbi:MAG: PAS domain S-box protein [Actinobacteria bacterium]|nr:MAG: PAS domain S-box protein [Actinomycetota bacterium]